MSRQTLRRIGFSLLALAAVLAFFAGAPSSPESDIDSALSEARVNEISAQGAPQQAVVNGWVARDLLEVIARTERDDRLPALLLIGVLSFLLHVSTLPRPAVAGDDNGPAWPARATAPVPSPSPSSTVPVPVPVPAEPAAAAGPPLGDAAASTCPQCDREFASPRGLATHVRASHSGNELADSSPGRPGSGHS